MFELTKELGGMTVEWLKANMSGWELSEWLAYYEQKSLAEAGKQRPTQSGFKAAFGGKIKKKGETRDESKARRRKEQKERENIVEPF